MKTKTLANSDCEYKSYVSPALVNDVCLFLLMIGVLFDVELSLKRSLVVGDFSSLTRESSSNFLFAFGRVATSDDEVGRNEYYYSLHSIKKIMQRVYKT
jgi:hypothetical protein